MFTCFSTYALKVWGRMEGGALQAIRAQAIMALFMELKPEVGKESNHLGGGAAWHEILTVE